MVAGMVATPHADTRMSKRRHLAPWARREDCLPPAAAGQRRTRPGSQGSPPPGASRISTASPVSRSDDWPLPAAATVPPPDAAPAAAFLGKPAIYHCISRVNERKFLLLEPEREHFTRLLRAYEAFCRVRVLTFCVMSNHFHILLEVPERPAEEPSDEQLLRHLHTLYAPARVAEFRARLRELRAQGNHAGAERLRQTFLRRMWDLSAFMQGLKQRFAQWYNRREHREGHLWSGRFKSVLVEDGHAARVMAAYIDLNPVRAGIVQRPENYRWSGYGQAVAGLQTAREGLRRLMVEKLRATRCDALATCKNARAAQPAAPPPHADARHSPP
jgi:REP element-mobilizing transposase RayT